MTATPVGGEALGTRRGVPAAAPRGDVTRPLGRTLSRYLARELIAPTVTALLGLTTAVLAKDLLGYADLVVNRGLGAPAVAAIALYQLIPLLTWTLPFALLVGVLVALGRLAADREILALEAAGVSLARVAQPVLAVAAGVAVAGLVLAQLAAPWARRELTSSLEAMLRDHPGAVLRAGAVLDFGQHKLLAREVSPDGSELRGVLLFVPDLGETLFAERADVSRAPGGDLALELHGGALVRAPEAGAQYLRFDRFGTVLHQEDSPLLDSPGERLASATQAALRAIIADPATPATTVRLARAEAQRRVALPVAALVFGLLAAPLALGGRALSRSSGAVLGLGVTVAYYGLVQLGNGLLRVDGIPVAVAVWLPNVVGAVAAAVLLARLRSGATSAQRGAAGVRRAASLARSWPRPLERYVLATFARLSLLSFGALLAGYLLIDVLERLEWFARHHAESIEVLRFYGARIPLLASRIAPMGLLAGASLTVSLLGAQGELVAMESCGIRLERGLVPVLVGGLLAAPLYFLLCDAVVPRTNALADRIKVEEIKDDTRDGAGGQEIWYRDGERVVRADRLDPSGGEARDLTVYHLGPDGFPTGRIDARTARHVGQGRWELRDARAFEISDRGLTEVEAPIDVELGRGGPIALDAMHLPVRALAREIRSASAGGYDTTAFRVDLHARLAAPLLCVLFPALALFYAIGAGTPPGPARSLLVSAAIAVGYVLISGIATSIGYGGRVPAPLASWSPVVALAGATLALAWRARR